MSQILTQFNQDLTQIQFVIQCAKLNNLIKLDSRSLIPQLNDQINFAIL